MEITGTFKGVQSGLGEGTASHVLAFWLDGNTVQIVEARRDAERDRVVVQGMAGHEDGRLLEVVERVRHPIYMDLQHFRYPDPKRIGEIVEKLLEKLQPSTLHTAACMTGETVSLFHSLCMPDSASYEDTLRGLLGGIRINNPYQYPIFFTIRRRAGATLEGHEQVSLSVIPYSDVKAFLGVMKGLPLRPVALSNSRQALAAAATLFDGPEADNALLLTDVGRLRTHYVGTTPSRQILNHTIPIGVARDNHYTYRALPLKMKEAMRLNESAGPLILGPELTPPSTLGPSGATPQLECTHAANQVARYLNRAIERAEQTPPETPIHRLVLSGLPSRLPGFRKFLQAKTGRHLVRPDHLEFPRLEFRKKEDIKRFADFLVPLGATLRIMGAPPPGITAIPFGKATINLKDRVPVAELEPGVVYRVDRPFKIV